MRGKTFDDQPLAGTVGVGDGFFAAFGLAFDTTVVLTNERSGGAGGGDDEGEVSGVRHGRGWSNQPRVCPSLQRFTACALSMPLRNCPV